jgi:hypothetical protein
MSVEMYTHQTDASTLQHTGALGDRGNAERVVQVGGAVRTLRCLSTGYLSGGRRCECMIGEAVVGDAWKRELERGWTHGEGFFRFTWEHEQWLGYGRRDGSVRGIYCPTHAAERDHRAFATITGGEHAAPAQRTCA